MNQKILVFLSLTSTSTLAFGAACVDVAESGERLACYDAAVRCGAIRDDGERLRCFDREFAGFEASPSTGADSVSGTPRSERRPDIALSDIKPSPAPASAPMPEVLSDEEANFGRAKQEPDQIISRLKGTFDGWKGEERFELENGQVWQVRRRSSLRRYSEVSEPKVIIRKNLFGFYVMDVPAVGASVPVTRVN